MKRIYPIVCIILSLLTACGGKNNTLQVATIQGEIKGLGNDTLYIYSIDELYKQVDTILVKQDKFTATLSTDTVVTALILFGNGDKCPIVFKRNDNIIIKGDTANLNQLTISGNSENMEYTAFNQQVATDSLNKPIDLAETFIKKNPSSLVSIMLLDKYFVQTQETDLKKIKELASSMTGELRDRPYIEKLLQRLKDLDETRVGSTISHFSLPNIKGERISKNTFKDKYTLIHFWASWDKASRDSLAALRRIYNTEKKNKHFAMLGISLDINKQEWENAIEADTLKWEQVCDLAGWENSLVKELPIQKLPFNILISPYGRIEYMNLSEKGIKDALKEIKVREEKKKKLQKNLGRKVK